mgnify:FL=1
MHKNDRAAQRMPLALKKSPFRDSRNNRVASSHGSFYYAGGFWLNCMDRLKKR